MNDVEDTAVWTEHWQILCFHCVRVFALKATLQIVQIQICYCDISGDECVWVDIVYVLGTQVCIGLMSFTGDGRI